MTLLAVVVRLGLKFLAKKFYHFHLLNVCHAPYEQGSKMSSCSLSLSPQKCTIVLPPYKLDAIVCSTVRLRREIHVQMKSGQDESVKLGQSTAKSSNTGPGN